MPDSTVRPDVAARIEREVAKIQEELPALASLLQAFKELLIEVAVAKADLAEPQSSELPEIDADAFRQGVPLAGKESFLVEGRLLNEIARRMLPAMRRGFPKIDQDLIAIEEALKEQRLDLEGVAKNLLETKDEAIEETARAIGAKPKILRFVVGWCLKPFVEFRAASIAPVCEQLAWSKGYCPICGSWPSLSLLRGQEGQRWVKCSFCGHEWRFIRTSCPFCDNEDQAKLEFFFSQERERERAEVCHACKRYMVGIDLRNRVDEPLIDVTPLGLVYLDILAQRQGFTPGAITDWNVLDEEA